MTEKEQQSTTQPEQAQSSHNHTEEEISLVDLLEGLIKKKVLIISVISFFTVFSIIYAESLQPTYKATIAILEPHEIFLSLIPNEIAKELPRSRIRDKKKDLIIQDKPAPFIIFLSKIASYKFKTEVFRKGSFLKKFYGEDSNLKIEHAALGIHNSIKITKEKADPTLPDFNRPVSIEMEGYKPEVMSEFLNSLVELAIQDVAREIKEQISLIMKREIDHFSTEIHNLQLKNRESREEEIMVFSEALEIANNLGIKNNNFNLIKNTNLHFGLTGVTTNETAPETRSQVNVNIRDASLPIWFLYGEKALQELIKQKNRGNFAKNSELFENKILLEKYKAIDLSSIKIEVAIISQPSIPPNHALNPKKREITLTGMTLGLITGLIMAFLSTIIDKLREKQKGSTPAPAFAE